MNRSDPEWTAPTLEASAYRYEQFTTGHMLADLRFSARAPQPGDPFPRFTLPTTHGTHLRAEDLLGRQPFFLTLGSLTCPMTAAAGPSLIELFEEFGEEVTFITLYTREAHPGEVIPQPHDITDKIEHARRLAERDRYAWHVAVDDVSGSLHQYLDLKPNAGYVVDAEGRIAFRTLWSSDTRSLRAALGAVARGEAPARATSRAMVGPMMQALPGVDAVVRRAGPSASRDLWRAAPPMALMAKLWAFLGRVPSE